MASQLPMTTKPGAARTPASLLSLPIEILKDICEGLCLHCRIPHVVDAPHWVVDEAKNDQKALSRLSRTCQALRGVAQPIVFHYYHSGSIARIAADSRWEEDSTSVRCKHRASRFLRAIILRPDLGLCVKALAFYSLALGEDPPPAPIRNFIVDLIAEPFGIGQNDFRRAAESSTDFFSPIGIPHIASFFCPNVEQLCVGNISMREWSQREHKLDIWLWPNMSKVRYLAFTSDTIALGQDDVSNAMDYHFSQAHWYYARCPNVETLIAADCGFNWNQIDHIDMYQIIDCTLGWGVKEDLLFNNLRKISVDGISPALLQRLIDTSPMLEDVEYYYSTQNWIRIPFPILKDEHVAGAASKLRRFCYSIGRDFVTSTTVEDPEHLLYHVGAGLEEHWFVQDRQPTCLGSSRFATLETLEVDQGVLYGPVFERDEETGEPLNAPIGKQAADPEGYFLNLLPASLRRLRIGLVVGWEELERDLAALARNKTGRFPDLLRIELEFLREFTPPTEAISGLRAIMRAEAGIDLSVAVLPKLSGGRGMLPPRPGHPETIHEAGWKL